MENPLSKFVANWSEMKVAWGPPNLWLSSEARPVWLGPSPVELVLTPSSQCES